MAASSSSHRKCWMKFTTMLGCLSGSRMDSLTAQRQVHAFLHRGFWQAMDTLRDKQRLEELVGRREGTLEDVVKTWQGRRVFLTGHTGFKGSWLALWLSRLGAQIRGYALDPCTEPNLFHPGIRGSVR